MNDMRCPYRILIADGGEDSAIEQHLRNHENYSHIDYEYIRYPYDATIEGYYRKLENVISRVESEYLLLADNDDFYLLERIPDILAFLDTQKDYVGARGQLVDLFLFDKAGSSKGLTSGLRYLAVSNEAPSIESASPFDRIEALCRDMGKYLYYGNWYCVFRSASLQEVWKSLITLPKKEVIVTEMLTHVLMLMRGKIKIMPYPFYIRQSNTSMHSDTLLVGNGFLERCLVNNALSEFGLAVDQFVSVGNKEERDRLLRAIAGWLEALVSNIHFSRLRDETSFIFRLLVKIKRSPLLGPWASWVYYRIAHLFQPVRRRNPVRFKTIEPYILP
jgi:glycosyltransferase domain-containing protein